MRHLVNLALFARLEARPGKEEAVVELLTSAHRLAEDESATVAWFAVRFGPSTFAIFDAFPDEEGKQAHLNGKIAKALMDRAPELFSKPPQIEAGEVLAAKLPL